jgi:hypothetical protein
MYFYDYIGPAEQFIGQLNDPSSRRCPPNTLRWQRVGKREQWRDDGAIVVAEEGEHWDSRSEGERRSSGIRAKGKERHRIIGILRRRATRSQLPCASEDNESESARYAT